MGQQFRFFRDEVMDTHQLAELLSTNEQIIRFPVGGRPKSQLSHMFGFVTVGPKQVR